MRLIWLLFAVSAVYIQPQVPDYPACDAPPTVDITTPNEERIPPHDGVVDIGSVEEFEELFVLAGGMQLRMCRAQHTLIGCIFWTIHQMAGFELLLSWRSTVQPQDRCWTKSTLGPASRRRTSCLSSALM